MHVLCAFMFVIMIFKRRGLSNLWGGGCTGYSPHPSRSRTSSRPLSYAHTRSHLLSYARARTHLLPTTTRTLTLFLTTSLTHSLTLTIIAITGAKDVTVEEALRGACRRVPSDLAGHWTQIRGATARSIPKSGGLHRRGWLLVGWLIDLLIHLLIHHLVD